MINRTFRQLMLCSFTPLSPTRIRPGTLLGIVSWLIILWVILQLYINLSINKEFMALGNKSSYVSAKSPSLPVPPSILPAGPKGGEMPPVLLSGVNTFANSYTKGQCTQYVAGRKNIPNNWGNARTWYQRASAAGWQTGTQPAIGAIAWTSSGRYGHVAVVEKIDNAQVLISEMNYVRPYVISQRWVPQTSFKYIY